MLLKLQPIKYSTRLSSEKLVYKRKRAVAKRPPSFVYSSSLLLIGMHHFLQLLCEKEENKRCYTCHHQEQNEEVVQ